MTFRDSRAKYRYFRVINISTGTVRAGARQKSWVLSISTGALLMLPCPRYAVLFYSSSSVARSPRGRPSSCALRTRRMILPLLVLGNPVLNSISLGNAWAASLLFTNSDISRFSSSVPSKPGLSAMKALMMLPYSGSGLPMTPASATAGCSSSATFHLERAYALAGRLDDVVHAPHEPEVPVGVHEGAIACDVRAVDAGILATFPGCSVSHHGWPAGLITRSPAPRWQ